MYNCVQCESTPQKLKQQTLQTQNVQSQEINKNIHIVLHKKDKTVTLLILQPPLRREGFSTTIILSSVTWP